MSSTVEIFLDNYDGCCYPGQTIAGRVDCYFNKQKNLRAIRIKFKGRAETEWTESQSHYNSTTKKNETRRVTYSACEYYFNAEYNLVQGGENFSLPPGRHSYPFSYILPQVLPSSFEGGYGNIRYSIKATVDRPWKFDYEAYVSLKVYSPLDLNYVPRVREPIGVSVDKNLCCCWCKSGPVTFEISLPATGYAPGQEVNIGAYVQNMSNVSAECVKFKVRKEIEFIAHHPSTKRQYETDVVTACRDGGIGAHGEKSWTSVLVIPQDIDYPNLNGCGIINATYTLDAKVVLPCPHTNLDTSFPFTIGNIPLSGINTAIPGPPPPKEFPLPNYNSVAPLPQINSYPPQPGATAPPPEAAPLLLGPTAPYSGGDTKYSPGMSAPYPPEVPSAPGGAPYPPEKAPYPPEKAPEEASGVPYPSGGAPYPPSSASAPYPPSSGSAPYPPSSGNAPYPPSSGNAPYPPSSGNAPYPPSSGNAPYPPSSGNAPYPPSSGNAPYPPSSGNAPYPPSSGNAPYPSSSGSAPYPPPSSGSAPYPPPSSAGAPYPLAGGSDIAFAPPSYEEAKKMDDKS